MVSRRCVWAIDRHDVHPRQHLVEAFPVGRVELLLDFGRYPPAVVVVDLQSKCARPPGDSLTDPPHTDDAETLAPDPVTKHPGRRPAGPVFVTRQDVRAFYQTARNRE